MNTLHVKRGDTVVVLSGKDKGKRGKVLSASPKKGTVIVEGIAVLAHHTKPRKQGDSGGIVNKETPIRASKVMRVCLKCGQPTRVAHKIGADGKKIAVCKKCGATL
ncbi:MAG: 50S ribosomal protein L24 [Clostridiaceae bacterium]|nr:50S ribosomal protein L24 [Clostridiaceae bacterium]